MFLFTYPKHIEKLIFVKVRDGIGIFVFQAKQR